MLIVVIIHSNKRADVETTAYMATLMPIPIHILNTHTQRERLRSVMFILFPYMTKVNGITIWIHEQTQWNRPNRHKTQTM